MANFRSQEIWKQIMQEQKKIDAIIQIPQEKRSAEQVRELENLEQYIYKHKLMKALQDKIGDRLPTAQEVVSLSMYAVSDPNNPSNKVK
jgi:hypothetical protein